MRYAHRQRRDGRREPAGPSRLSRREVLGAIGAASAILPAAACGQSAALAGPGAVTTTATTVSTNTTCAVTPTEVVGPYPSLTDLIRSDIREGRSGTPVTLTITVVNVNAACAAVSNAMVDIWQCDADGRYSQYTQPGYDGRAETFLRGIQITDASGRVTFTTIYPGWYQGRATHIHVEVTVNGRSVKVTQIAFPDEVTASVYRTGVYAGRGQNPTSNTSDSIFADSLGSELAAVSGSPTSGYTATFQVGIAI